MEFTNFKKNAHMAPLLLAIWMHCLICILLICFASGCYVEKSWSTLRSYDFEGWSEIVQKRIPFNAKEHIIFEAQYVDYLIRVRQLQLQAETELDENAAKKVSSFAAISDRLLSFDRSLSAVNIRYDWYGGLYKLSPSFEHFCKSKRLLKNQHYDQSYQELALCPQDHPSVVQQREKATKAMLFEFAQRIEKQKTEQQYDGLAEVLDKFKNLVEKHGISLETPYHNIEYPTYTKFILDARGATAHQLEQSAKLLTKAKKYMPALKELDKALLVSPEKDRLKALQSDIRKDGIIWHDKAKEQAITAYKYDVALLQLDTACLLDTKKDCTSERNQLRTAQLIQKSKKAYDDGKGLKEAVDMLWPLPDFVGDNEEAKNLSGKYRTEYGDLLVKEAARLCEGNNHKKSIDTYKRAETYLGKVPAITQGISDCNKKECSSLLMGAARYAAATNPDCKHAAKLAKEAMTYVECRSDAQRLYNEYKGCATKRIAIVLQANDAIFSVSSEKYAIIDAVASGIREDEYTKLIYSHNLPVIRLNADPVSVASQVEADYVVVLALDKPDYQKYRDGTGTSQRYCTSSGGQIIMNGLYPVKYPYVYTPISVMVYYDHANVSMNVRAYLLETQNGNQLNDFSRSISKPWSQDYWYANIEAKYICECPRGPYLTTPERTNFISADRFSKARVFPSGFDLIRNDLHQALRTIGTSFTGDLAKR